jgi:hypothetical protein
VVRRVDDASPASASGPDAPRRGFARRSVLTWGHTLTAPDPASADALPGSALSGHGIDIVVGDGVDLIDTRTPGRPSVHFTRAEFEAFVAGVREGEFDLDVLIRERDQDRRGPAG